MEKGIRKCLTIAGSDSGGGAGIQADLKTFAAFRVYGATVVTAATAQNTLGVQGLYALPPEFVARQLDSVLSDIGADAAKTGMLANEPIVRVVAGKVREYRIERLVVDPVMVAKSGDLLLCEEARARLKSALLPLALVVTPNIGEAEVLSGLDIRSVADMKEAATVIHRCGPRHVLVKGGHLPGEATDVLFDGKRFELFTSARIGTANTHGAGCTFSAAIAAGLARGEDVERAVRGAKLFMTAAIAASFAVGRGYGPVNQLGGMADGAGGGGFS